MNKEILCVRENHIIIFERMLFSFWSQKLTESEKEHLDYWTWRENEIQEDDFGDAVVLHEGQEH